MGNIGSYVNVDISSCRQVTSSVKICYKGGFDADEKNLGCSDRFNHSDFLLAVRWSRTSFKHRLATFGVCASTRRGLVIPEGETIEIHVAPLVGARLIDVIWAGRPMIMFNADLTHRAEQIKDEPSAES